MTERDAPAGRSVVLTLGPPLDRPWWWTEIQDDPHLCRLDYHRIVYRGKTSRQIGSAELLPVLFVVLREYWRIRPTADYIFTFECDLTTFAVAFWQTVLGHRRPRHVVLQFIMREKTAAWTSRAKYSFMRWCFQSLHRIVCSATAEAAYYERVFSWPPGRAVFVPFHTSRTLLATSTVEEEPDLVVSVGRSFRDFSTLVSAVSGAPHRTVIVAGRGGVTQRVDPATVTVLEDVPLVEADQWLRRAPIVVVPLQDTNLSAGQLVLLHAMALGKAVIATRTVGTVDYVEHGVNGILVPPSDPEALRAAIAMLRSTPGLRESLGARARASVEARHLPNHYTRFVREVLSARPPAPRTAP